MRRALIGHSGFIGGNLKVQATFDDFYNSGNIEGIADQRYDLIACAGTPGLKWLANKEPAADWKSIKRLMAALDQCETTKLILISTVDVYPRPVGVDENTIVAEGTGSAYGQHRLKLENFVRNRFDSHILRLPGLFGQGLKNNVIFDFINNHQIEKIDARSVFQFYDLENLWTDIEKCMDFGVPLLNVASEPVAVSEIARECFERSFDNQLSAPAARYDFKSKHAALWGGQNGYLYGKKQIFDQMKRFVGGKTVL